MQVVMNKATMTHTGLENILLGVEGELGLGGKVEYLFILPGI